MLQVFGVNPIVCSCFWTDTHHWLTHVCANMTRIQLFCIAVFSVTKQGRRQAIIPRAKVQGSLCSEVANYAKAEQSLLTEPKRQKHVHPS